jgi:F-type H+-transporting ATPase subunit gamma
VILVVGSERGLCGRYNAAIVDRTAAYLASDLPPDTDAELIALGSQIGRLLQRAEYELAWTAKLSLTATPSFDLALGLSRQWLKRHDVGEIDGVYAIHNAYRGLGDYRSEVAQLIPGLVPPREATVLAPIVETDPASLRELVVEQMTASRLHAMLVESAAAEHSTRYQLMDGATQNIARITEELQRTIHSARQQEITREMQELAAGAGMVGTGTG